MSRLSAWMNAISRTIERSYVLEESPSQLLMLPLWPIFLFVTFGVLSFAVVVVPGLGISFLLLALGFEHAADFAASCIFYLSGIGGLVGVSVVSAEGAVANFKRTWGIWLHLEDALDKLAPEDRLRLQLALQTTLQCAIESEFAALPDERIMLAWEKARSAPDAFEKEYNLQAGELKRILDRCRKREKRRKESGW